MVGLAIITEFEVEQTPLAWLERLDQHIAPISPDVNPDTSFIFLGGNYSGILNNGPHGCFIDNILSCRRGFIPRLR